MTIKGIVKARGENLSFPLTPIFAGQLSSMTLDVTDVDADIETLKVCVARTLDESGAERLPLVAEASKVADGSWHCYLNPYFFPDLSRALTYSLVGVDDKGNPRWLGTGRLEVLSNPANGSAVAPEILPKDCYAYNPTTKLYHKITASLDEYGNISLDVDADGIER